MTVRLERLKNRYSQFCHTSHPHFGSGSRVLKVLRKLRDNTFRSDLCWLYQILCRFLLSERFVQGLFLKMVGLYTTDFGVSCLFWMGMTFLVAVKCSENLRFEASKPPVSCLQGFFHFDDSSRYFKEKVSFVDVSTKYECK